MVIPASTNTSLSKSVQHNKQLRVAAYCRVSSNSADQQHSYANQIRVYTKKIKDKREWELVEIFADEGISGTRAENRPEFQRMIRMCEIRKIDLIITKSISRFGRNVKETLEYARKLKLIGVGVIFEKEGIDTLALGDEMLLSTFAAIAQEESQAISQNQRLSITKRMEMGEYVSSSAPYGYRLIEKRLEPYEPEAMIIRYIFHMYLQGHSTEQIAKALNRQEIPSWKDAVVWRARRITYILSNEKYVGDTLFQKTYGEATVPFKRGINRGQEDKYYAKGTHVGIIDRESFERAQALLAKQRAVHWGDKVGHEKYPLTSRIRCVECGSLFYRKVRAGTIKWVCAAHAEDCTVCDSAYYTEERIYDGIISILNKLRFGEEDILGQVISKLERVVLSHKRGNQQARQISTNIAELNSKLLMLDQLRAKGYLAAEVYQSQAREIQNQLALLKTDREDQFESKLTSMLSEVTKLQKLINEIEEPLESFDQ